MRNITIILLAGLAACSQPAKETNENSPVQPKFVTDTVNYDSDDPAIWINKEHPEQSLIIGTDKHEQNGGVYVFSLEGKIDPTRKAYPLDRPNNVDIAYNFPFGKDTMDVAVTSERGAGKIRVFSLPDMEAIDNGGLPVFEDDSLNNRVMGVALYTRPSDHALFAIVSRKEGENISDNYLYQYQLFSDSSQVKSKLVRKFGKFSGTKEIEAVAVDTELGYVYYSDEHFGIHKYYADPEKGNEELAVFGRNGFADDREGISIYKHEDGTGYILVSDQGANKFHVFSREGSAENPHQHDLLAIIPVTAMSSDGSEVTAENLGENFPKGLFVAMSDNKTFEIYDWRDLQSKIK